MMNRASFGRGLKSSGKRKKGGKAPSRKSHKRPTKKTGRSMHGKY